MLFGYVLGGVLILLGLAIIVPSIADAIDGANDAVGIVTVGVVISFLGFSIILISHYF